MKLKFEQIIEAENLAKAIDGFLEVIELDIQQPTIILRIEHTEVDMFGRSVEGKQRRT
jgi:hypothetical protein